MDAVPWRGAPMRVGRPWFSGNRQRSGAIKRVICVLQFDPAALGAVPRDRRVIYANSSASGSPCAAGLPGFLLTPDATVVPSLPSRCRAASDTGRRRAQLVVVSTSCHQEDPARLRTRSPALSRRFFKLINASF